MSNDKATAVTEIHNDGTTVIESGRRRVPRRAIQARIGLLVGGQYYIAKALEIGEGGMLIESPVPLAANQRTVISFRIPGVVQSVILSRVVYVLEANTAGGKTKYGMQFDKPEFDVKRKIRNFVASGEQSAVVLAVNDNREI
jgi:PilZ domain